MQDALAGGRLAFSKSLRLRLPLLLSGLIALVLTLVFGAVDHRLQKTLVRTGSERAQAAADQISTLLAQSAARTTSEARRIASDAAVRNYLTNPDSDSTLARAAIAPLAAASQPMVELRSHDDRLVLDVGPSRGKATSLDVVTPLQPGLGAFAVSRGTVFYALVIEITQSAQTDRQPAFSSEPVVGYLVIRRTLTTTQTTDTLNQLVGNGAHVAIGQQGGAIWTDFSKVIAAPPISSTQNAATTYRQTNGEWRIGAISMIAGTPWAAWVEFPRDRVLAPAFAMRREMVLLGVGVVALSALLVSVVTGRITTPLHELASAAAAIASGDYNRRVRTDRGDEIGWLGATFNAMTERVAASHQELEARVRERTTRLSEATDTLKQRVTELNAVRRELDQFFSLSLDMLCIAGTDGRFHRVNPAWHQTLGWTPAELTAVPYGEFIHPDDLRATQAQAAGLAIGGNAVAFENRYRAKDGTYRWLSWKATCATEHGLIYAAARDVTAAKQTAQDLERHVGELNVINEELESFSYSVSHDLRAPIRHVVGFASMLEKSAGERLTDQDRRYVRTITESATRMGRLIDDLLSFSRMSRATLERRPVSLDRVVREALQEIAPAINGRQIDWKIQPLPCVIGDPAMLRCVFVNLLSNAVKYSSGRNASKIEVNADRTAPDQAVVYVRDNGVGFDMTYVDKLFGVFQRLHRADEFEGTGIGLANVRRIIHRHGGKVWAESVVNEGATFYLSIPRTGEPL